MNLDPRPQSPPSAEVEFQLKRWLPVLGGLVAAVYAGYWVGNNNWVPLCVMVSVTLVCFVAFSLQENGWILIPMFWMATGSIASLPLPFSYRDLAIMLAVSTYLAHRSIVKAPRISMRHVLFVLLMFNLAWVAVAWLRKPVGLNTFGSEMIGARTYINMFMAAVAAWVLLRLPQSAHKLSRIPYYLLGGTLVGAVANTLTFLLPATTGFVLSLYREASVYVDMPMEIQRFDAFRYTGTMLILLIVSHRGSTGLFHPARPHFYLLLVGLAGIAISGFRNVMGLSLAYIGLSMILRRNWRQLAMASTISLLLLGALVFWQSRFYSFPLPIQRSLCFLPGNWSPVVLRDTSASTEGRLDWWRDIIKYRLIKNWWTGDGIGVRASEILTVNETSRFNYLSGVLFYGAYHNGPLTTIRCVGIVGLLLLYALMIIGIFYALRCLKQCRETSLESLAMFIAIPIIWYPFHFTILFGSFENDLPEVIFQTSLLLLLIRMINEHPELLTTETVSD